ncbi:MAG: hypothetical protein HKO90_07900 [Flavobacteriaceae bacterium]|nr:hypothetical protein [Flavobacteriaceae bacterium]
MINGKKFGLSLSGGGYRATAYHIGTLRKLRSMGLLDKIDVLSSNSGGSITAATYALYWDDYDDFEQRVLSGLKKNTILFTVFSMEVLIGFIILLGLLAGGLYLILTGQGLFGLIAIVLMIALIGFAQFGLLPFSLYNAKAYSKFFFGKKHLKDFTDDFIVCINSTNLETGRLFVFSKDRMGDSTYEYDDGDDPITFKASDFPVGQAVAASTAVPGVFTPMRIKKMFYDDPRDISRAKPRLVDGGVYDNQGLHKLTQRNSKYGCTLIVVSDAGNMMPFEHKYPNALTLLFRTSNVFMNRIKNLQMIHQMFQPAGNVKREVAYQSLGFDVQDSIKVFTDSLKQGYIMKDIYESHGINEDDIKDKRWDVIETKLKTSIGYEEILKEMQSPAELKIARGVGTNLVPLSDAQVSSLISHASVMTEIQVKLYCPSLTKT